MKRQRLECDQCKRPLVLGQMLGRWWSEESGETFLIHALCERAFLTANGQQEEKARMSNDGQ